MRQVNRLLSTTVVIAAAALSQVADAAPPEPVVPTTIQVGAGNKVFLVGHAVGVQIYSCNAAGGAFSWGLVAPRANLYDDHGKLIVKHYGGPTWRAKDGSTLVGRREQQVTVDATAIPWLLLSRASATAGEDGDRLVGTTFVQRIATKGGLAPAAAQCDATTAGDEVEVPYTADYYFWKATGA